MKKRRSSRKIQDKKGAHETQNGASDSCISALPASILTEIFLRFPIVDLMKLKLVCTSWYKLISESSFTDIYCSNSPFTTLLLPMNISTIISSSQVLYLLEISENGNCIRTPIRPRLPGWMQRKSSEFVIGSCNGLLSLSMQRNGAEVIYVSNPIMGEYVELPEHERDHDDTRFVVYKIGFSPSVNNFKVLRIVYKTWLDTNVEECEIFTVGVDERWRRLDNPFMNLCYWVDGISLNGAFHWILRDKGSFQISTFNLAEERAGQVLHPPGLVLDSKTMNLALFDNQLSLVDYSIESQITIWTMKEYRNAESWTKDVILRSWFPPGLHISKLSPVGKLQNGDIIFGHSADLISFNVKQKKCSRIGFFGVPRVASRIIPYAPSFKSLSEAIMRGHWNTINN
ncbi:hypothetical protein BUALT_Bualt10G0072900 [Buddleja alternifolia]|uniref:F-box domain-containing protein n=1 Tax=Buddleja alternifolia TaxID=168488 RepID=A0AAV6WYG6_9LAMI|nr:hypothetical protein BUALT_Bualt10G0072900 [Buddleja alternifolia]